MPSRYGRLIDAVLLIGVAYLVIDQLGLAIGLLLVGVYGCLELFGPLPIDDVAACAQCQHPYADHHGNCQECLRARVRGLAPDGASPCSKFRRTPTQAASLWTLWWAARRQKV